MLDFIKYAHSKNIIHRDLKPENILLSDTTPHAVLKVIDFGTSDFCLDGERLSQKFGTPYYVAPEVSLLSGKAVHARGWWPSTANACRSALRRFQVLQKNYDKSADIWSAGVILYILLCGYPPFGGKTDAKILQRVQQGMPCGGELGSRLHVAKDLHHCTPEGWHRATKRDVQQSTLRTT